MKLSSSKQNNHERGLISITAVKPTDKKNHTIINSVNFSSACRIFNLMKLIKFVYRHSTSSKHNIKLPLYYNNVLDSTKLIPNIYFKKIKHSISAAPSHKHFSLTIWRRYSKYRRKVKILKSQDMTDFLSELSLITSIRYKNRSLRKQNRFDYQVGSLPSASWRTDIGIEF